MDLDTGIEFLLEWRGAVIGDDSGSGDANKDNLVFERLRGQLAFHDLTERIRRIGLLSSREINQYFTRSVRLDCRVRDLQMIRAGRVEEEDGVVGTSVHVSPRRLHG